MADNVIKKVVDMRKGKTAILPSIVTNPELTGEEESLKSVEINGQKFTIGDGQLKLVATGTAIGEETSTNILFNLDKPLEKGKNYLLILKDEAGTCNVCSTILTTMSSNSCISYILGCAISYETDGPTEAVYWAQNENDLYYSIEIYSPNGEDLYNNGEVLEVYELPLTFNEEPKPSNKMKLVATFELEDEYPNSISFKSNYEVEDNKLYLLCIEDFVGIERTSIIGVNKAGSLNVMNTDEDTCIPTYVKIGKVKHIDGTFAYSEIDISTGENNSLEGIFTGSTLYLYELPYELEI